jgi:hypothetical protein
LRVRQGVNDSTEQERLDKLRSGKGHIDNPKDPAQARFGPQ